MLSKICTYLLGILLGIIFIFGLSIPLKENSDWKLSELNGYIAIYDPSGFLFELTNISLSSLPKKEQEALLLGLTVNDHIELEQILEGLTQ
ncbi:MAG TPA: hypothetical protein GX522_05785 [Firmicutes bacterium]|nr:hypothetical protein [Bacillota bacterium]